MGFYGIIWIASCSPCLELLQYHQIIRYFIYIYIYIDIDIDLYRDREREREIRQWCTGLSKAYRCSTALSSARSARTVPSLLPPWLRIGPWIFSFGLAQWKQNRQGSRGKQYKQICCFWRPETWYSITIDPSRQENSCQIPGHQKNPCSKTVILRIRCCRKQWPWPGPISIRFRRNWTMLLEKTQQINFELKKKTKKKHYFQAEYWPYWNSKWQMDTNGVATLSQQNKNTQTRGIWSWSEAWEDGAAFAEGNAGYSWQPRSAKDSGKSVVDMSKTCGLQRFDRRYHENKCAIQEWEHIYIYILRTQSIQKRASLATCRNRLLSKLLNARCRLANDHSIIAINKLKNLLNAAPMP